MTELVVLEKLNPMEVFTPQGTDDILERIKKEAKSHVLDISTPDGRAQIKSLAYNIARSKTFLDDMGKKLVEDAKAKVKLVDDERKRIRDSLDELKEEVRAPLTEWENKDKDRVALHESQLSLADQAAVYAETNSLSSEQVQKQIDRVNELFDRDWQEFAARAELTKKGVIARLEKKLAERQQHEAEQAELERLRREEAARKQREHEERLQAEAAAKAKAQAEEEARKAADAEAARVKAEQDKAEQERQRIQREKEESERQAKEAEARAKKAEEDRIEAAAQAERDRIAAAEKAKRDADAAAQAAAKAERDRIEGEQRREAEAAAKREADKKHKAKVNNEVLEAMCPAIALAMPDLQVGKVESIAKVVISAIAKGDVPNVKINY